MTRTEILDRVAQHLCDVLDLDHVDLTEASTAEDFEEWDSINHVRLLIQLEQDLGVHFATSEVRIVKNVGELIDLISTKLSSTTTTG